MENIEDLPLEEIARKPLKEIAKLPPKIIAKLLDKKYVTLPDLVDEDILNKNEITEIKEERRKIELERKITEQKNVEEKVDFEKAKALKELDDFLIKYPDSKYKDVVNEKIAQIERIDFEAAKKNINAMKPDEAKDYLGEIRLRKLCDELKLDADIVINYEGEPEVIFGDDNDLPQSKDDIPSNFTDVFFWGVPSSGKSCALAAILSTINRKYLKDLLPKQFGQVYRESLEEIFTDGTVLLPAPTPTQKTRYMPFRLKRDDEKDKYRNIAFFELSGEIFKCFDYKKEDAEAMDAFKSLQLLLDSKNKKVHFFFVDYVQTIQKREKQAKYLKSAAAYFNNNSDILTDKTVAVYVVVTKADEIKGTNGIIDDRERSRMAGHFLKDNNFNDFVGALRDCCKKCSIKNFRMRTFSIGEVYFKSICKVNPKYSINIIDDLLKIVKPPMEEKWYYPILKFINK